MKANANQTVTEQSTLNDGKKSGNREMPHIFLILFIIIIVATILTWIIPAGQYTRVMDNALGREVIDPNSFKFIRNTPVGPFEMFVCIEEGLINAANICFLIFTAFASLQVIQRTGAIDAFIASMLRKTQKHPASANIIIVGIMIVFSVWGSTGTFSYEEVIAFIPIFVTVAYALGYDAMVGVAISVIPVGIGFASATINPFTIGVAQSIAQLKLFSGLGFRLVVLAVMTTLLILYTVIYARKIKKDPRKSITRNVDMSEFQTSSEMLETEMTTRRKLILIALLITIATMAWGLLTQGWYINECAALFLILTIVTGIIAKWNPNKIAKEWVRGLSKAVLPALTVGIARSVLVVFEHGHQIDSIIHGCVALIQNLSLYASGIGMLLFQTLLNLLIPSGSGQAAVSMPIMTPIADLIGMNRQIAVLIFQFGDGFSNLIWPTSFMVVACAMAKIPLSKYYKWLLPFFGICFLFQCVFIMIAIAINYQ